MPLPCGLLGMLLLWGVACRLLDALLGMLLLLFLLVLLLGMLLLLLFLLVLLLSMLLLLFLLVLLLSMLLPGKDWIYVVAFGIVSLLLQIFVPYTSYVKYLKWLTLSLFAYVATAFFVKISWHEVVRATVLPQLSWSKDYLTGLIAVLGTTISPYLFFWQASQEVEDLKSTRGEKPLKRAPRQAPAQLGRIRKDTYFGMALSNIVAFFIILTTAATLHAHGQTDVATAAQAAQALAPLAGRWAEGLFV